MIKRKSRDAIIDEYLDIYNDYQTLYKMFGDKMYLETANYVLKILREKV